MSSATCTSSYDARAFTGYVLPMQPQEPIINDPDDAPNTTPGGDVINDPDIPVDAPVDDVYEPNIEGPDVVD
jgi:hypothetical protein